MCTFSGGDAAHPLGLAIAMATQRRRNGKGNGKANPAEDEAVYQAILHALLEGKLKAGIKLAEPPLADIFGVSREHFLHVESRLHLDDDAAPVGEDLTAVFGAVKPKRRKAR